MHAARWKEILGTPAAPPALTECALMPDSRELLHISIAQLRALASFLSDQLGANIDRPECVRWETLACEELVDSLRVLISQLQAAGSPIPAGQSAAP